MPGPDDTNRRLRELTHDRDSLADDLAQVARRHAWWAEADELHELEFAFDDEGGDDHGR